MSTAKPVERLKLRNRCAFATMCLRLPIITFLALSTTVAGAAPPKVAASLDPAFIRAVSALRGQLASVKWMHDICVEQFPSSAETTDAAYSEWKTKHAAFVSEVEGKVQLIDRQTKQFASYGAGLTAERMDVILSASQADYKKRYVGEGPAALAERCRGYRAWERSPSADPEAMHGDWVAKIREYASD